MAVSRDFIVSDEPGINVQSIQSDLKSAGRQEIRGACGRDQTKTFKRFDAGRLQQQLDQFTITYEADSGCLWCDYTHADKPCYTPRVLEQIIQLQAELVQCSPDDFASGAAPRFLVWGSELEGVFNLGGDLELFVELIRSGDEDGLRRYAYRCVDTVYNNFTNVGLPLVNIALVQGDALGGGFEAALTGDVIIAERQSKFGLPEVLFNLFPGMGAYSLLCRRLDGARAKQMILSGRLYSAEEMHELGIVDVLVETGEGKAAVRNYVEQNRRRHRMLLALGGVRRRCQPLSYEELIDVTDLWVDTALNLQDADLKRMERLVGAQKRRLGRMARRRQTG